MTLSLEHDVQTDGNMTVYDDVFPKKTTIFAKENRRELRARAPPKQVECAGTRREASRLHELLNSRACGGTI